MEFPVYRFGADAKVDADDFCFIHMPPEQKVEWLIYQYDFQPRMDSWGIAFIMVNGRLLFRNISHGSDYGPWMICHGYLEIKDWSEIRIDTANEHAEIAGCCSELIRKLAELLDQRDQELS